MEDSKLYSHLCAQEDSNFHGDISPPAPQAGASTIPPCARNLLQ